MILPPFAHADAVFGFEDILEPLDVLKPAKARYFVYGHLGFCQIVSIFLNALNNYESFLHFLGEIP